MKHTIELNARFWEKAGWFGICEDDLKKIRAEQGNWLRVKYEGKTISARVREVEKGKDWPTDYPPIFIQDTQREKLGFPSIRGYDGMTPSAFNLTVWKQMFPPIKILLPAIVTFALLLTGIILKALSEGGILPQFKVAFDSGLLVLAIISAGTTAYELYAKKQ